MSPSATSPVPPVIIRRLRAAGCVFAEDEARLLVSEARGPADLEAMIERRIAGTPLELVLGWAEFCGLRIAIEPGVFVPRRRTEFLVHRATSLARPGAVVVDLCCGSGALGVALLSSLDRAELYAADIDANAVACARRNVGELGRVYQGDLFEALPVALHGRIDILMANVPYVPTDEVALLPPEARLHEPLAALDGGVDGLALLRRVADAAPQWLMVGGHLLVETSERQAGKAVEIMAASGLVPRVDRSDELGATVVIGSRPHS